MIDEILDMSRQKNIGELSPWFAKQLAWLVKNGDYRPQDAIGDVLIPDTVNMLRLYREQTGRSTVVLGMSGGVDSALTAALFRDAGWSVIGVTLPIHQEQVETDRGFEACEALGIKHLHLDLSDMYDAMVKTQFELDGGIHFDNKPARIRCGNIRARLRMITLYNLAQANHGLVASTDNYTELAAGFWTLHGDVGDVSPIQAYTKSWDVPVAAKLIGVPEATWRATPTDGLGIDAGDEAQLGASYLEWDIMLLSLNLLTQSPDEFGGDRHAEDVYKAVTDRIALTWFKRMNPVNLPHAFDNGRYAFLEDIDRGYRPHLLR